MKWLLCAAAICLLLPPRERAQGTVNPGAAGDLASYPANGTINVDGITYRGAQALQSAVQACSGAAACMVDARNPLLSTQTFTANPFSDLNIPITLLTGAYTISVGGLRPQVDFPSHFHWIMDGTVVQSASVQGYPGGEINSRLYRTTGTIASGSKTLMVANALGFIAGGLAAVVGAAGGNSNQSSVLSGAVTKSATTLVVASGAGWGSQTNATYYPGAFLLIGSELMQCTVLTKNTFSTCTRGMFGTTAASHNDSATVYAVGVLLSKITGVRGTTITIKDNASFSVMNATAYTGVTDVTIDGNGTFDGTNNPNTNNSNITGGQGINLRYSTKVTVGQEIRFINQPFAGVYLEASWYNIIGGTYQNIGKLNGSGSDGLGADIWLFDGSSYNAVMTGSHKYGTTGLQIDDRSNQYQIDNLASSHNTVYLGPILDYEFGVDIEASCSHNTVYAGRIRANQSSPSQPNTGITIEGAQWTTQPTPQFNTVYFGSIEALQGTSQVAIGTGAGGPFGGPAYTNGHNKIIGGTVESGSTVVAANDILRRGRTK